MAAPGSERNAEKKFCRVSYKTFAWEISQGYSAVRFWIIMQLSKHPSQVRYSQGRFSRRWKHRPSSLLDQPLSWSGRDGLLFQRYQHTAPKSEMAWILYWKISGRFSEQPQPRGKGYFLVFRRRTRSKYTFLNNCHAVIDYFFEFIEWWSWHGPFKMGAWNTQCCEIVEAAVQKHTWFNIFAKFWATQ